MYMYTVYRYIYILNILKEKKIIPIMKISSYVYSIPMNQSSPIESDDGRRSVIKET